MMQTLLFLLFQCGLWLSALHGQTPSLSLPGPFPVGERALSFTDTTLNNGNVATQCWYPALSGGIGTPIAPGNFPVIAFGHGFNLDYRDYGLLCGHLASYGFVVISPDVQNGFNVDHLEYARELAACVRFAQSAGGDSASFLYQHVDSLSGVCGHSMGGGASSLVPSVFPDIDAVSGFAAAETNPSAIAALSGYAGPWQAISGSEDNVAPESGNQEPMYNSATGERHWISLTGGGHCKFTDGNTVCDFVSAPGSISRAKQISLSRKYSAAFFLHFLSGRNDVLPFLCGDSVYADTAAGTVRLQTTLNACTMTSTAGGAEQGPVIYPNPARQVVSVRSRLQPQMYDIAGREILLNWELDGDFWRTQVGALPRGLYCLRFADAALSRLLRIW